MATKVSIANQALGWLGANLITAFTDNTNEAKLIDANYDDIRDTVLEERAWTFATRRILLVPSITTPTYGWSYQFLLPGDILRVLEARNDKKAMGPNGLQWVREGDFILSDSDTLNVRYLVRLDDPAQYSPSFSQALAARLAADLAIPLTESRSLQQSMFGLYAQKLKIAAALDGMQGRAKSFNSNKLTRVRGAYGVGGGNAGPYV